MVNFRQKTVARPATCIGVGVHSGKPVTLTVKPAPPNHGIKFARTDLPDKPCVCARFNKVVDTSLATVIGEEGFIVSTIEHVMAGLAGMGIDNARIEVDSYELPIMDGSARPFVQMLKRAGIKMQDALRHFFIVRKPIEISQNEKFVGIYPDDRFRITCTIEYDHPLIKTQTHEAVIDAGYFENEIAGARTFGFFHEVEYMQRYGLGQGASLENVIVIDRNGVMNKDGLRYKDEFVRHKILDCIGDFSLLGLPILGHVVARRSGHNFNHAFLKKFFQAKDAWQARTFEPGTEPTTARPFLKQLAN